MKRPLRPSLGHTEERGGRTRSEDPLRLDHRGEAPLTPSPSTPENEKSNAVGMTAAQQANDGRRVAVTKRDITLDTEWCEDRFIPADEVPFENEFTVYTIESGWHTVTVPCSAEEEARWRAAADRFLDALSDAYARLLQAHGVRRVYVDLRAGRRGCRRPRRLPPFPGRRRWFAARSRRAQQEFLARARAVREEYEPVRTEIERRIQAEQAEQEARARENAERYRREQERRREEERRRRERTLRDTRRQRVWAYAELPGDGDDIVYVYRHDRPPAREIPPGAQRTEGPLNVAELEAALRALDERRRRRIVWDPEACAEVERICAARKVHLDFDDWWEAVASGEWRTQWRRGRRRRSKTLYVTTHHSAPDVYWPDLFAVTTVFGPDGVIGTDHGGGDYGGGDYGGGDYGGSDGGAGGYSDGGASSYGGSDGGASGYGGYSFGGSF